MSPDSAHQVAVQERQATPQHHGSCWSTQGHHADAKTCAANPAHQRLNRNMDHCIPARKPDKQAGQES